MARRECQSGRCGSWGDCEGIFHARGVWSPFFRPSKPSVHRLPRALQGTSSRDPGNTPPWAREDPPVNRQQTEPLHTGRRPPLRVLTIKRTYFCIKRGPGYWVLNPPPTIDVVTIDWSLFSFFPFFSPLLLCRHNFLLLNSLNVYPIRKSVT